MKGRVLKGGSGARIVEGPVYDAQLEAADRVATAKADADRILAEAEQDAERLRAKAIAEGRERGLAAVTELLVGARAAAARARDGQEAALRTLAVRIAEKILGRELALRPDAVTDVCAEAVARAGEAAELVVRAHPDDLEALKSGKPRLLERVRSAQAMQFRADDTIPRGGCIIETELGLIDARLSVQLEAIERALRGESGS